MGAAAKRATWPRLSESLTGPRAINRCQRCGSEASEELGADGVERTIDGRGIEVLPRWQEHDARDQPEPIVVVLCKPCSDALVEPHPRLYAQLPTYQPFPGAMGICLGCIHQVELRCVNPRARANGGEGVRVNFPRPTVAFVDGTRGGRRAGWQETWYHGPATACDGREGNR